MVHGASDTSGEAPGLIVCEGSARIHQRLQRAKDYGSDTSRRKPRASSRVVNRTLTRCLGYAAWLDLKMKWLRVFRTARASPRGHRVSQLGQTRAVRSEKYAVLRHGGGTGRCSIAAYVARALQRRPGRACIAFLLIPQEVRRVYKTCTQFDPKTLDSLVHYIPSCRIKGKSCDVILRQQNQGRACRECLLQQAASPCTARGNMLLNSGPCASTCLMVRLHRTVWQSALTFVRPSRLSLPPLGPYCLWQC